MHFKKQGLPEEGDIVLCTVRKILYHSVFVNLDEYDREAMVHISEIAPGRIRNIRDYVVEGKKLVCKVLRINRERKHVDLSLRRVSLGARKKKNEEYKQEMKAEKMLENVAIKLKEEKKDIFKNVGEKIIEEYGALFPCFQEAAIGAGESVLRELKIEDRYIGPLMEIILERIKPPEVLIEGTFTLSSTSERGIEDIKKVIAEGMEEVKGNENYEVTVTYVGAPNYKIEVKAEEFKIAEEGLQKVVKKVLESMKAVGGSGEFNKK